MKKNLLAIGLFLLAICQIQAENSALVSRVIDYRPAPATYQSFISSLLIRVILTKMRWLGQLLNW